MEGETKPRELTKDLIRKMWKEQDKNARYYGTLQVYAVRDDYSFMTLSDGHSVSDVALFKSIRPKATELNIKVNDILYATLILHNNEINVMTNFERLYTDVNTKIGQPIPFSSYQAREYINPDGETQIPRALWEPKKAKATSSSIAEFAAASGPLRVSAANDLDSENMHPINTLTAGTTSFYIKAKVLSKSRIREFNQGQKKGSVCDILIADSTDEIKGTFFTGAVEKFYDKIEVGKVYVFINGEVRKGGKWNNTSNPNEIHFNTKSEIILCSEPVSDFKAITKYKFKKIGDIQKEPLYALVDVIGVVSNVGESKDINIKSGGMKAKQSIMIRDDSNYEIEVTFWGSFENQNKIKEGDVVILTNLQVGEFSRARVLSTRENTVVTINPTEDIPEVRHINLWKGGNQDAVKSLKPESKKQQNIVVTLDQLRRETEYISKDLAANKVYTVSGYVINFGQNFTYQKCPHSDCYKKAQPEDFGNGTVSSICDKHGQINQPPVPKFIGSIRVVDHTGSAFLNFTTDPVGQILFGCSAQDIIETQKDRDELVEYLKKRSNLKFTFKVSLKFDQYQGQEKIKFNVLNCFDQAGNRLKYENLTLLATINRLKDDLI